MNNNCKRCVHTESQMTADAKTLGLLQELESGVYTCCQVTQWADEQCSAWFEAIQQDGKLVDDIITARGGLSESEFVLVPVRVRQAQVPWYRNQGIVGRDE